MSPVLLLCATVLANPVADLEELAAWCTKNKLIGSRNRVYETILQFDADHAVARKWLRYTRRDGSWVRPKGYRPPPDRNKKALPEFRRRRRDLAARYAESVRDDVTGGSVFARQRAIRDILVIDPDNKFARHANRETKHEGRWVLAESVRALARRDELRKLAREALNGVPKPLTVKVTAEERGFGVPWKDVLHGQWWRFVGTVGMDELREALVVADASATFFNGALPDAKRAMSPRRLRSEGFGLYMFNNSGEGHALIRKHPGFTESDRKFALQLEGAWVPDTYQAMNWYDTRELRLDSTARFALDMLFMLRYDRSERGWVSEGLGLYLSWYLVGTRLVTFVERSRYARPGDDPTKKMELWKQMQAPGADWLQLARNLRADGKAPDLVFMTSKRLNQMDVFDLIHAHSLAAYMVEGWPDRVAEFFAAYVKDGKLDVALQKAYGFPLPELKVRLSRWLDETR